MLAHDLRAVSSNSPHMGPTVEDERPFAPDLAHRTAPRGGAGGAGRAGWAGGGGGGAGRAGYSSRMRS